MRLYRALTDLVQTHPSRFPPSPLLLQCHPPSALLVYAGLLFVEGIDLGEVADPECAPVLLRCYQGQIYGSALARPRRDRTSIDRLTRFGRTFYHTQGHAEILL